MEGLQKHTSLFVETHHASIVFATGKGCASPPQHTRFFELCKLASKHVSPGHGGSARRMSLFETHNASIVFANGVGLQY